MVYFHNRHTTDGEQKAFLLWNGKAFSLSSYELVRVSAGKLRWGFVMQQFGKIIKNRYSFGAECCW